MNYDYLVIGAGASGMTSALLLAKEGYRVALIEQSSRLAPLLRGFSRRGVYFDTGFHYSGGLGRGEILDLFFRYLGLSGSLRTTPFDFEGFDVVRSRGRADFAFPVGPERLSARLRQVFPGETAAIESYLAEVASACARWPYLNLEAGFEEAGESFRVEETSLRGALDRWTDNVFLKRLLEVHTLLHGVAPTEVPFDRHAAVVGSYYQSAHGLEGGGLSLAAAFEIRLAELGVDLFRGREVRQLLFSPAGVLRGARFADGERLEGSGCVATLHPSRLPGMVPDGMFRPGYRRRLLALEDSSPAFILYGICREPRKLLHGRNFFLLAENGTGQEETIYLTSSESRDSDCSGLIAIVPTTVAATSRWQASRTGRRPADYGEYKRLTAERLVLRIQDQCPELGNIEVVETATALTLRDYLHAPGGALYGVRHCIGQFNPQPRTRIPNLLLAGQAVAAPGVLGAVLSGFLACGTIIGHDRLRERVKRCR